MKNIVTKDYLKTMVEKDACSTIGRALAALLKRQTLEESKNNTTSKLNGVGFSKNDGRIGTLGAKTFLKNGPLQDWQIAPWLKPDAKGYPRICKYWRQLNEIANERLHKN